jgi:hypothetical protein
LFKFIPASFTKLLLSRRSASAKYFVLFKQFADKSTIQIMVPRDAMMNEFWTIC